MGKCILLLRSKHIFQTVPDQKLKQNVAPVAGWLGPASAPQISCTWHAAGELKGAAAGFIVAGSLSLPTLWSLSPFDS